MKIVPRNSDCQNVNKSANVGSNLTNFYSLLGCLKEPFEYNFWRELNPENLKGQKTSKIRRNFKQL